MDNVEIIGDNDRITMKTNRGKTQGYTQNFQKCESYPNSSPPDPLNSPSVSHKENPENPLHSKPRPSYSHYPQY